MAVISKFKTAKGTETEHVKITKKAGKDGYWSIGTKEELQEVFSSIIGQVARSVWSADVQAAFDSAMAEWPI